MMMNEILVVCIGNICRSPMAEAMLKRALPSCTVRSAGLGALVGHQAEPIARKLMKARGFDISKHRARQLEPWMVEAADLVLVMDKKQKRYIEVDFPVAKGKVFRLGEPNRIDITDPYQQDVAAFQYAAELIAQNIPLWVSRIQAIAKAGYKHEKS